MGLGRSDPSVTPSHRRLTLRYGGTQGARSGLCAITRVVPPTRSEFSIDVVAVKATRVDNIPTGWYLSGMESEAPVESRKLNARDKLLAVALSLVRTQGYAATSVDDLCRAAGVTKGAFFHHFSSKEALGVAVAEHWSALTGDIFAHASYHALEDPLDRVLAYLDFRKALLQGTVPEFTCLVGTMVQEAYNSSPAIRAACNASISDHADLIAEDLALAMTHYDVNEDWSAESLALHSQAVLQGAFILSKMRSGPEIAADSIDHMRRYIALLFNRKSS